MSGTAQTATVRSVSRALAVLDAFATAGEASMGLSELVRRVGLPRTTVLRLVDTLVAERMLESLPDGGVAVGSRMARWAVFAQAAWAMPTAAQERMAQLATEVGETVSVYVREGTRRLALAQAPGPHAVRHVVQVGDRLPLWRGASALVLLAAGDEADAAPRALSALRSDPDAAALDEARLAARVADVRARGWAVTHGEREPGISGVAVPLARGARAVVLAIGGPTTRFTDERIPEFVSALQSAAEDIRRAGLPPAVDVT
ncbi:IclR family transcriptional regulator [Microbacterium sp. Marseille-Q6965]|uniref:IclR family transcriptional regulator n=1 Tax=Microbacterium sp. Marseille-Q6965 TaxID=2965072 RepID=UPI0021B7C225|nr:IclR family transcriptional regulator [Microbacterium sp. Marseille-Q6965]